jgi:hypothetical protein
MHRGCYIAEMDEMNDTPDLTSRMCLDSSGCDRTAFLL